MTTIRLRVRHEAGLHARTAAVLAELAGDPEAIPLLVGLGLDTLSISPSSIPGATHLVRRWSFEAARRLGALATEVGSADAVGGRVRSASGAGR
jgi:phosphotransferase system enzyme I (PtsI)